MKIIQVINAMITNSQKISDVNLKDNEYFFLYNNKYKWSISKSSDTDNYWLHYYPHGEMNIKQLSQITNWTGFQFVSYSTEDIKTKEAYESFTELYQIVQNKLYGLDAIFEEIITDF